MQDKKIKVLWLTSDFPIHPRLGRNLYLWHPVDALKKYGAEPVVMNVNTFHPFHNKKADGNLFSIPLENSVYFSIPKHYFRATSNYSFLLHVMPRIKKLHQQYQFDVVHAHGEIAGLAAINAHKKWRIPSVVTIHGIDMCPRMTTGIAQNMFDHVFNEANRVIYVGEALRTHFSETSKKNARSCIVHNGCYFPSTIKNTLSVQRNDAIVQIISVSNLNEGKGVDITLEALSRLNKRGVSNWNYTIIGDGPERNRLQQFVRENQMTTQVQFLGACSHDLVYENLAKSDIFCLPSYREAFGIAYVEAMAHGLLTIGVKGQGPEAFIVDNQSGFLVEPNNADALADRLANAMMQWHTMESIRLQGQEYVLTHFTWEKHAEKLISVYKDVICENR